MKISIVMPVDRRTDYLSAAIESILGQTYQNIELILINNIQNEKEKDFLREYRDGDKRIRLYNTPNKKRLSQCLNFGFSVANGNYFMKMSDNIVLTPNVLERIMHIFKRQKKADFIYTDVCVRSFNGMNAQVSLYCNREMGNVYLYDPARVSFVYKREVHERIGGYRDRNIFDINNDFWIRVQEAGFSMYHLKTEVSCLWVDSDVPYIKNREKLLDYNINQCREVLASNENLNIKIKILHKIIGQCNELGRYYDGFLFKLYFVFLKRFIIQGDIRSEQIMSNSRVAFDKLADSYEKEKGLEEPRKCYIPVMRIVKETAQERIKLLDIGCGTGVMLQMICDEFGNKAEVDGIDISGEMVKKASRNLQDKKARIMQGTIETVQLPIDFYNMALCMHSFHHYPKPLKSLWNMRKVLCKGGKLIIADNRYKGWKRWKKNLDLYVNDYPSGDMWMYSVWELYFLTRLAGFHKQEYVKVGEKSFIFICEKM